MNVRDVLWKKHRVDSFSTIIDETHVFQIETAMYYQKIEHSYAGVLSEEELQQAACFMQLQHQQAYIARRHFLRSILSKFTGISTSQLNFKRKGNRKPFVDEIEFNSTHSGKFSFIAISRQPVGIDTEEINYNFDFHMMIDQCFSEKEIIELRKGNLTLNFFKFWTRKEALLKASGEGLIDDLRQVNILNDVSKRINSNYYLQSIIVKESQLLSIATASLPQQIQFWLY